MNKIYNFHAGPAMLPKTVLMQAQKELINWNNFNCSIMEISHRSKDFIEVAEESEINLRKIMHIPTNYKVIFCQGGARGQFSAIPMNLLIPKKHPEYINSGHWSYNAMLESKKYCVPYVINVKNISNNKINICNMKNWNLTNQSSYVHYCPNETVEGIAIYEEPNFVDKVIVGDFSSTILSRVIDITKYGVIYASAQKNIGIAGLTLIIIREDLINFSNLNCPSVLNYKILVKNQSMFNTPPTFAWYLSGLIFKWIKNIGGVEEIEKINKKKSDLLYNFIDNSNLYTNNIIKKNRSTMNVTFVLTNSVLEKKFLQKANSYGLYGLKGHSIIGGMRASIYNAMPLNGIQRLIAFMNDFEHKYG